MTPNAKSPEGHPRIDAAGRILQAAEVLFSEHGFDAVSVHAIAEKAGVSKANVFHHFSSKDALYLAVLKSACEQSAEMLHAIVQDPGPIAERLAGFTRSHLTHILERRDITNLILREQLKSGPQRSQDLAQQVFGENFARFVDILRRAQTQGELRADIDPAMVAAMIISGNLFFFQSQRTLRHFPDVDFADDAQAYSRKMVDLLLNGILSAPPHKDD